MRVSRSSVIEQATAALRSAIDRGELGNPLPGGYQLAQLLGVSRPSVRAALRRLAVEGVVAVQKGRRSRLVRRPKAQRCVAPTGICVAGAASWGGRSVHVHPMLLELHSQFASRGIRWEGMLDARLGERHPGARLKQLVAARPHVAWILFTAPPPIQRWFAAAGVPALVLGSCAEGVALPSIDYDYAAMGWHSAGAMVRHGHVHLGLVLPAKILPGDAACREGVLRFIKQHGGSLRLTEVAEPEDPAQLRARLKRALCGPNRPTAVLNMRPNIGLVLITEILAAGLRIPADISVILRDTHPLIETSLPEYTRYLTTASKLATRAVRLANSLLLGRKISATPSLITPEFIPGSTLATHVAAAAPA